MEVKFIVMASSLNGSDEITLKIESGNPGVDLTDIIENMRNMISEWYDTPKFNIYTEDEFSEFSKNEE